MATTPFRRSAALIFIATLVAVVCVLPQDACAEIDESEGLSRVERAIWARDAKELPSIREWAKAGPEKLRERSLGAIGLLGDSGAKQILLSILADDPSPALRRAAAEALGSLKIAAPSALLLRVVQIDPDTMVRAETVRSIGRSRNKDGSPALYLALGADPSFEVRALSADALGKIETPDGAGILKHVLANDQSTVVRLYAVRSLGTLKRRDAIPEIRDVLKTARDPELRAEAFRQLLVLDNPDVMEREGIADKDDTVRFEAVRSWLGRQRIDPERKPARNDAVVIRLDALLSDPLPGLRGLAREGLIARGFNVSESSGGTLSIEE